MTTECSWEEFKQMAKEFHDAAPTLNAAELNNAWKCLGIGYLGMTDKMWQSSAAILLRLSAQVFTDRDHELSKMHENYYAV